MNKAVKENTQPWTYEGFISSIEDFDARYAAHITPEKYFGYPLQAILDVEKALFSTQTKNTAYFSMEFGIAPSIYNSFQLGEDVSAANRFYTHEVFSNYWLCDYLFKIHIDKMLDIPIYGGGLGVLAGDTMKSAADEAFPVAGMGILWNKGYFKQNFWYKHGQVPQELKWDPSTYPGLIPLKHRVTLETKEGPLELRLWKYYVYSFDRKHACPIILLDSNLRANQERFQRLTDQLYRSDEVWWKIYQRAILGVGGMKALECLGYRLDYYHLNEGHAAFALVEKYVSLADKNQMTEEKKHFSYTCHTPVAAGHDRFQVSDVQKILTDEYANTAIMLGKENEGKQINLTHMCLEHCQRVNAVAQKHGEITRLQFPEFASKVQAITNGIHIPTWVSKSCEELFDKYAQTIGDWRRDQSLLQNVMKLKDDKNFRRDLFEAHQANKRNLINTVRHWKLKEDVLTIGWARRIAGYKRPALIFHNIQELIKLAYDVGPIQIILAGKAHPNDNIGSAHIEEILDHIDQLNQHAHVIKTLILENYDTYFGKLLTNSVDVWLNNPLPPFEASGTSGMKAILNGVVQVTTLDGWVVEAEHDDIGWIFGHRHAGPEIGDEKQLRLDEDSRELYQVLTDVIKLYYDTNRKGEVNLNSPWIDKMIHCVARSSFFNTQRMVKQYNQEMWPKNS